MIKLRFTFILLFVTLLTGIASSQVQSKKEKYSSAIKYVDAGNYKAALPLLLELYENDKNNCNLNCLVGICYLESNKEKKKSIPFLEKAQEKLTINYRMHKASENHAPVDAIKFLGEAYHYDYQFDKAIEKYEIYAKLLKELNREGKKELIRARRISVTGKRLFENPIEMRIVNLGGNVNSPDSEYAPAIIADETELYFTSRRNSGIGDWKTEDGKYYEDIYVAKKKNDKFEKAMNLGGKINSENHDATMSISADGNHMLIYKHVNNTSGIYITHKIGTNWTKPEDLGSDINTSYWETHATISADGQMIFFVSDRPGGKGGRDLYFAKKTPTGIWALSQAAGLDNINSRYDEESPYLHPDGKTLYFSSKGHSTMGGFDIFVSEMDEYGIWSEPKNIGYPINTTGDDVFFVPSVDGKRAYYSSEREDGFGGQDIYLIHLADAFEKSLTVYKGVVHDYNGVVPEDLIITAIDESTGNAIGEYRPNSKTGKFLLILEPSKTYSIDFISIADTSDFIPYHDTIVVADSAGFENVYKKVILDAVKPLAPDDRGLQIHLIGEKTKEVEEKEPIQELLFDRIYFSSSKSEIDPVAQKILKDVFTIIQKDEAALIKIVGYTDSKGEARMNKRLSLKRAKIVRNYLVKKGIPKEKIFVKGMGEENPIAPNQNKDGSDNPEGRKKNRRTEIKVVK